MPFADPVGLDYWIWPGRAAGLGSSLSALPGRLPARSPSARRSDGAGPVRAENRIHSSDQRSCSLGSPPMMITDHVPSVGVPSDHATRACPVDLGGCFRLD